MIRSDDGNKNYSRRKFLKRGIAFALGSTSAGAAIYLALEGSKIDQFLSRSSKSILSRFGTPVHLLNSVQLSRTQEERMVKRIESLKEQHNSGGKKFENKGFTELLRRSIRNDFRKGRIVIVEGWFLSETEFGIFLYNKKKKYLG